MSVVLDLVYNPLGPEGNYLAEYGPYFTERYQTPWGSAVNFDGADAAGVRRHFVENARYWVRDLHVDGFRLDAIHAIYDESPLHIPDRDRGSRTRRGTGSRAPHPRNRRIPR